jgi:hypothetical protein
MDAHILCWVKAIIGFGDGHFIDQSTIVKVSDEKE